MKVIPTFEAQSMTNDPLVHYAVEAGEIKQIVPEEYNETYATEFRKSVEELGRSIALAEALERINHTFLSVESNEHTSLQYNAAIAGVFAAAGLDPIIAGLVTASFESDSYSPESGDGKKNILKVIWELIKKMAAKFIEGMRKMLGMRIHQAAKVDENLAKIKEIIPRLSDKKVKPFTMSPQAYGFDKNGKFGVGMSQVSELARNLNDIGGRVVRMIDSIRAIDPRTNHHVRSSKDVYEEIHSGRKMELPFLNNSVVRFDPAQHSALWLFRGASPDVRETTPLSINDLKSAVIAQESLASDAKRFRKMLVDSLGNFESLMYTYRQTFDSAEKKEFQILMKNLDEIDRKHDMSLASVDAAHMRGEDSHHGAAAEKAWKQERVAATNDHSRRMEAYSGYKYLLNAITKLTLGFEYINGEVASVQTCNISVLKKCVECYTTFEKYQKPAK